MELTISEIAEIAGVSPNTLRNWENKGLISPERTKGNQRIFKKKDYYTILYILYLSKERKMPLDDIPQYLNNPTNKDFLIKSSWTNAKLSDIEWKKERKKRGWTLEELSDKSKISISYLSKIENNEVKNISLNVINKLAEIYGMDLKSLYSDIKFNETYVVRKKERPLISSEIEGVKVEKIGQTIDGESLIMSYELDPMAERENFHTHNGFEILYVEEGTIIFYIENEEYELYKGDTIQFESKKPHRYKNLNERSRLIWTFFGKY